MHQPRIRGLAASDGVRLRADETEISGTTRLRKDFFPVKSWCRRWQHSVIVVSIRLWWSVAVCCLQCHWFHCVMCSVSCLL